jgi:hypothetical protein
MKAAAEPVAAAVQAVAEAAAVAEVPASDSYALSVSEVSSQLLDTEQDIVLAMQGSSSMLAAQEEQQQQQEPEELEEHPPAAAAAAQPDGSHDEAAGAAMTAVVQSPDSSPSELPADAAAGVAVEDASIRAAAAAAAVGASTLPTEADAASLLPAVTSLVAASVQEVEDEVLLTEADSSSQVFAAAAVSVTPGSSAAPAAAAVGAAAAGNAAAEVAKADSSVSEVLPRAFSAASVADSSADCMANEDSMSLMYGDQGVHIAAVDSQAQSRPAGTSLPDGAAAAKATGCAAHAADDDADAHQPAAAAAVDIASETASQLEEPSTSYSCDFASYSEPTSLSVAAADAAVAAPAQDTPAPAAAEGAPVGLADRRYTAEADTAQATAAAASAATAAEDGSSGNVLQRMRPDVRPSFATRFDEVIEEPEYKHGQPELQPAVPVHAEPAVPAAQGPAAAEGVEVLQQKQQQQVHATQQQQQQQEEAAAPVPGDDLQPQAPTAGPGKGLADVIADRKFDELLTEVLDEAVLLCSPVAEHRLAPQQQQQEEEQPGSRAAAAPASSSTSSEAASVEAAGSTDSAAGGSEVSSSCSRSIQPDWQSDTGEPSPWPSPLSASKWQHAAAAVASSAAAAAVASSAAATAAAAATVGAAAVAGGVVVGQLLGAGQPGAADDAAFEQQQPHVFASAHAADDAPQDAVRRLEPLLDDSCPSGKGDERPVACMEHCSCKSVILSNVHVVLTTDVSMHMSAATVTSLLVSPRSQCRCLL